MSITWRRAIPIACIVLIIVGLVLVSVARHDNKAKNQLIGLGDSYASGEGLPPFIAGSDTEADRCHQSAANAYPVLAAAALKLDVVNHACSGATTDSMLASQLTGLNNATDITITIGGNDVNALGAVLTPPTPTQFATELTQLQPKLVDTYKRVTQAAPKAHVVVTGYPDIIPTTVASDCFLKQGAVDTLNTALVALNNTIRSAAAQSNVGYTDLNKAFEGHEICSTQPWVNGINFANFSSSLHPTADGQKAIASAVVSELKKP